MPENPPVNFCQMRKYLAVFKTYATPKSPGQAQNASLPASNCWYTGAYDLGVAQALHSSHLHERTNSILTLNMEGHDRGVGNEYVPHPFWLGYILRVRIRRCYFEKSFNLYVSLCFRPFITVQSTTNYKLLLHPPGFWVLHIHVCMSVNACLHVHVCLAACLHVHLDFFLRFCSCHTPQVPGHVCISLSACPYISACPCFLSCRFACPCLTFLRFCSCHTPQGPSMSVCPCLHVRKCMCACPCLLSCMFACPFGFVFNDFAPVIPHKSQVMSAYPCLHVHICISACPCFLSCRFACPFGVFFSILLLSYPTSPKSCLHTHVCMSIHAFLHVHACMFMSACLHVCVSMSKCTCFF